ncbi:hypothetical protein [Pimelobacter simplex]|uniref:hypothetical protein n=1 Tax=Nocardioides simplex TaxID=2045 RepID=UPI003AAB3725
MTQQVKLGWAPLEFVDPGAAAPAEGYLIEAMADGTDFGNPEARVEIVQSLLTDGALAVLEGWDNREAPIRLRLSAPAATAGPALAAAEKALMAGVLAASKAPLVYTPAATSAATCVFDVVAAKLERDTSDGWDLKEERREYRFYLLTLTCLPFARPESTVVTPAIPIPPNPGGVAVFQNLDTCDTVTNWAPSYEFSGQTEAEFTKSFGAVAGAVRSALAPGWWVQSVYPGMKLTRTGALSMAGLPYLAVDVRVSHPAAYGLPGIVIDGAPVTPLAAEPVAGGFTRIYVAATNFSALSVVVPQLSRTQDSATRWLEVSNVARTDAIGDKANSTSRQQSRTASVGGSAPTQAAIRLFDATPGALGTDTLIHTSTNLLWRPPLRRWISSSSAVTADTSLVSGGRNSLATPTTIRVAANLLSEGNYALMARMSVTAAGTLTWSARMVGASGSNTVGSSVVVSGSIPVSTTAGYQVLNLAAIPLPVVAAEGDQLVELVISGTASMILDEAWLFGLHDGALTWIRDADALTWVEVRSPELGAARPSVYGGTGARGSNSACIDWKCLSFGAHRFSPGVTQVFTITSSSLLSQSELEFYPRYHSHVA